MAKFANIKHSIILIIMVGTIILLLTSNNVKNSPKPVNEASIAMSNTPTTAPMQPAISSREIQLGLAKAVGDKVPYGKIDFGDNGHGQWFALLYLTSYDSITYMGEYIVRLRNACASYIDDGILQSLTLIMPGKHGRDFEYFWTYDGLYYGVFLDNRSGEAKACPFKTINDVAEMFPQLYLSDLMEDAS